MLSLRRIHKFKKNFKLEKFLIFTSIFHLKCFNEITELFIDGTFKSAPINWYQLVNIFGFIKKKKIYLPLEYIAFKFKKRRTLYRSF